MPDREQLLRWALENPQPPATFDIGAFKACPCARCGTHEVDQRICPESTDWPC